MHKLIKVGVASAAGLTLALASAPATASPVTLTFEGLGNQAFIPNGYGGLNWQNFATLDTSTYEPSGYVNGVVSGDNVALNAFGDTALILESATPFDLLSGYFTAAWNDGLTVSVLGFNGATQIYSTSFVVNTSGPSLHTFNWTDLTSVQFSSFGGIDNPAYGGSGTHFALDNLTVNMGGAVPEPGTWAMMLLGFGGIGLAMRKRGRPVPQAA